MKKALLLFLFMFALPVFATGINGASAPCDNATLSKYTGTADIEINWEPNTINLRWSDGDTQLQVASESQSCVYDNVITVPPQPTKLGYTFNGWKVDHSCGLKNIDPNINATGRCYFGIDGKKHCFNGANYNLTENGTYAVVFDYGTVVGEAICSSTTGYDGYIGMPDINSVGEYCWCRITGYAWPEGGICSTVSGWMYENLNADSNCASGCSGTCAYRLYMYNYRRKRLYDSFPQ